MLEGATANGVLPPWQPDELGLVRAGAASFALLGLIAGAAWFATNHIPKQQIPIAPTTTVHLVTLAKPPPPLPMPPPPVQPPPPPPQPLPKPPPPIPAPSPVPPPKPVPRRVIHHPPPPPVHHPVPKPRPVVHPKPRPVPKPRPKPPPQPAFNFQSYAASLRGPLQREVPVTQAMRMLGVHGIAYVEFTLAPSGHLIAAKIYRSSGNPLIDKAALNTVRHHHFPPFPGSQDKTFALPIQIEVGQ